ncbi:carbonic anhydrase family protein [Enterobacteriaceae bacterium H20N1]|uniref:Carbonic anhydrase n=1 Tax=Dryocola boscaweniae TaxID=2925397 RepID=A0A9X2W6K4_9ENTR|nr:carbonic anhydrase family protein [Dryocola boscaweniae]MCT4702045.1 carbonic anhydrase family protein [Dryocola boscaweniae]MCT4719213.1 carbonic anhydrase family protein [Dryocola boscaweniae]
MNNTLRAAAIFVITVLPDYAMASHWSYEGAESPEHWSETGPENQLCKSGMNQSPVNIDATVKAHITPLKASYMDSPVTLLNNGHTIQAGFAPDAKDTLIVDGAPYQLEQLHFHAPSENTIHGKHYAMEMHLVHKNAQGEIAVVAVMFETGEANSELDKLWRNMPAKADESFGLRQKIDVNKLLPKELSHYRFSGSLTTPPCSEGVRWLVMKHPVMLSEQQLHQFTAVMHHDNNRPVQPLHGRVVVE